MRIERFADQYDLIAPLFGRSADEQRSRDEHSQVSLQRWVAIDNGEAAGVVTTFLRPDQRLFLMFRVEDVASYGPLAESVATEESRSLHTSIDIDDGAALTAVQAVGFEVELEWETFRIRFDRVLAHLRRAWLPSGFTVRSVDELDEDRMVQLDNAVRSLVPGTDGWEGDIEWFRNDIADSPPFDRDAYLVAVESTTGAYAGLVRVWRNAEAPRLGLIGVLPEYRSSPIAAALLKQALTVASTWGSETWVTETSPVNPVTYPRMARIGAERTGGFLQMVRPAGS